WSRCILISILFQTRPYPLVLILETEKKYRNNIEEYFRCTEKCGRCGEGWRPFGVKCYFFSTDFLNWTNSRDRCVEKGGHLAIITSQAEQTFVTMHLRGPHWFGLNDLETEGKWMWVNNQPLTDTGVTFWNKGKDGASQPNNRKDEDPSGENCASLGNENGDFTKWFDGSCSKTRQYLCEM
uniref:C-type lectin domain-containing protein n=1 Tax=Astyanax mexicanus TaxID=7994 RepID=A0A3B1IRN5_ASTMX